MKFKDVLKITVAIICLLALVCFAVGCKGNDPQESSSPTTTAPTPDDDTPGDNTPGDDTPGDDTPGDDTPGDDTPGDDTPGDDTPGDDPQEPTDYNNDAVVLPPAIFD